MLMEDCSQKYNVEINKMRCIACGNCVGVCPAKVLRIDGGKAYCQFPARCIACGHCAAICPEDAIIGISCNEKFRFSTRPVPHNYSPIEKLLSEKRSVRRFLQKSLAQETIEKLLYFAEKAPSSRNSRTRSYHVLSDPDSIHKAESVVVDEYRKILRIMNPVSIWGIHLINPKKGKQYRTLRGVLSKLIKKFDEGESPVFRNAPCVIIGLASKTGKQTKDDAIAAQHYMMLYAQSLGIGSCIIGYAQYASKGLAKRIGVAEDQALHTVTALGYPVYSYKKEIIFPMPEITCHKFG
jgi:nitroreductase/NAD-dependent dihydropyrimidine dehydrogenase PreA subunit